MKDSRLIKPTLHAELVKDLLEGATGRGVDERVVLETAGVHPDILVNLKTRISIQIYYRILSAIREHLQDEMMGFLDRPVPPRAFPVMCEAAVGYQTFEEVIRFANDFYGLLTDEFRWHVERDSKESIATLSISFKRDVSEYRRFIIEFLMVATYRFQGWLIGEHFPLHSVHFTFSEPEITEKYHYLLSNQVFFDADRNKMVFDAGVLSRPVIRNRNEVPSFLRSSIGWFLLNPDSSPYTRMVRKALSTRELKSGFPHFDQVAKSLSISHQHLWRKLNQEGTSYQQIKSQMRRDMAIHLLINTQLTIQEIAEHVGYSAERPFYRMFTQWTGMAPGEYRKMFQMQLIEENQSCR